MGGWVGLRLNRMRGARPSGGMDGLDSARRLALAPDPPSIWDAQRSRSPPFFFFFFCLLASSLAGNLETPGNGGESGARLRLKDAGGDRSFRIGSLSLGILTWCVCVFVYVYSCINIFFNFNMLKKLRPPSFGLFGD